MKRFFIIVIMTLFSIVTYAQAPERMKFLGIELSCSIDNFKSKLEAKGYKCGSKRIKFMRIQGPFMGETCYGDVNYDSKTGVVYNVEIEIQRKDLLSKLEEKYGVKAIDRKIELPYGVIECDYYHISYTDKQSFENHEKSLIDEL